MTYTPSDTPDAFGPARMPSDLESSERQMAAWFGHLERVQVGADRSGLQARILAEIEAPKLRLMGGRATVQLRPRLAFALVAAVALFAIGLVAVMGAGPDASEAGLTQAESAAMADASRADANEAEIMVWVMDDPDLVLYHDLETFDGLGRDNHDLLALGGR